MQYHNYWSASESSEGVDNGAPSCFEVCGVVG